MYLQYLQDGIDKEEKNHTYTHNAREKLSLHSLSALSSLGNKHSLCSSKSTKTSL